MKIKYIIVILEAISVIAGLGLLMSCDKEETVNSTQTACIKIVSFQQTTGLKTLKASQSYTFTREVKNEGPSDAKDVTLGYYLSTDDKITSSDTLLNVEDKVDLSSGANNVKNVIIKIPASVTIGNKYYIGILVKSSSCTNNCPDYKSCEFYITETSEIDTSCLNIQKWQISTHPNNIIVGGKKSVFQGEIRNDGQISCQDVMIKFYLSTDETINPAEDVYLDYISETLNIPSGSTVPFEVSLLMPSDKLIKDKVYYVGMQIENSTCAFSCPTTAAYPVVADVVTTCFSIDKWQINTHPNNVVSLDKNFTFVTFNGEIKNNGPKKCSSIWIEFYLSRSQQIDDQVDKYITTLDSPLALDPGASASFQVTLPLPNNLISGQTYYIGMCIANSSCANSCQRTASYPIIIDDTQNPFTILLWQYLSYNNLPSSMQFCPLLYRGDIAKIKREIQNTGPVDCSNVKIGYYLAWKPYFQNAIQIGEDTINLAAGEINSEVIELMIPSDLDIKNKLWRLHILIKSSSCTAQSGPWTVIQWGVADYVIYSCLYLRSDNKPSDVICGQTYTFNEDIVNPGWKECEVNIKYYISTDSVISSDDIYLGVEKNYFLSGHSKVSDTVDLTIPKNLTPGKYFISEIRRTSCPAQESICTTIVNVSCP